NMQVLIDGRSVYEASHGLVAWNDLPVALEDIARIEVIRGPNAATYGANAYAATINIITFHPAEQSGVYTRIASGRYETDSSVIRANFSVDDSDHRVSLKIEETDGLESRYDTSRSGMMSYRGSFQLDDQDNVLLALGYNRNTHQDGFGDPTDTSLIPFVNHTDIFDVYQPQREIREESYFGQMKWSRRYSSDEEISLQYYYNYQLIEDAFQTVTFSEYGTSFLSDALQPLFGQTDQRLALGYGTKSSRHDLELAHTLQLAEDWRLAWGAGTRIDSATSFEMFGTQDVQSIYQFRLFANAEWIAQDWLIINAGNMVEKYEDFSTQYSPRLASNFHLDNHNTIRLSVTDAYRMPTLIENHANQAAYFEDGAIFDFIDYGPGNLEPEKMRAYEVGYILQLPSLGLNLDIKAFKDQLRNMIELPKDHRCLEASLPGVASNVCDFFINDLGNTNFPGRYTYSNNGDADIQGIEMGMMWQFTKATWLHTAYAFADIEHRYATDLFPDNTATHTNQTPRNTWAVLLAHNFDRGFSGSIAHYSIDAVKWLEDGDYMPAYDRTDARLARRFKSGKDNGEIAVIAQNIGNHYQDFQYENEIREQIYLELKIQFN
ncbi:MAG TPA: TonB-dependent receptor, partial [Gammaproteobacteria bacterium]|nr:TonB-dependent receptor [Gammaproteobacteria bacterium]